MSTLKVTNVWSNTASTPPVIADSAGTQIGTFCRAWVNFNGTGTIAIRASFNVSSITDNATGDYTVNLTTAMPDANYAAVATTGNGSGSRVVSNVDSLSSSHRVQTMASTTGGLTDFIFVNVAIFR
jgi:hypothetical protein